MDDLGVIDRFLNVFNQYIDSGFGLLGGEVAYLSATLIAIDLTLVGIFWAMGGGSAEDVIGKLLRKTLYIGAFAFIINNWNALCSILFRSFAGLGLIASGSGLPAGELLRPGRVAAVGVDAARPILDQIGDLAGFPAFFASIDSIAVLAIAWLVVIVSFFVLSVQMFVALIEFKLTTLAGFVLVPFALWNKTAFLAERVLGNVVSSGVKVLVLAVIIGIGTGIFAEFTAPIEPGAAIDHALAVMLASMALFGLGLFGPGVATGLVSGAAQLGAGAAAGTVLAAGGIAAVTAGATVGAARASAAAAGAVARTGAAGYEAFKTGAVESGAAGPAAVGPGLANVARAAGEAISKRFRNAWKHDSSDSSRSTGSPDVAPSGSAESRAPGWAEKMRQNMQHGASTAGHIVRSTDAPGSGPSPKLTEEE